MRSIGHIIVVLAAVILVGCGGRGAQIPSQRKGEAPKEDSAVLAVMNMNMQLAKAADDQIRQMATTQEEAYALYNANCWMHIIDHGNEDLPLIGSHDTCALHMRVYTTDGRLLTDEEGNYALGKNELPIGVEWNLSELHPESQARLFVPWYMAYGQQGSEHVPPYENVIIEIELR